MLKKEFELQIANDIDDDWFQKINKIFETFKDITEGELVEVWLNDSLCFMDDLYTSACKFEAVKKESIFLRKKAAEFLHELNELENENDELKTQLLQYQVYVNDLTATIQENICKDFCPNIKLSAE